MSGRPGRLEKRPRVVKLGGSLLEWSDWPAQFRRWFAAAPSPTVLISGGGTLADAVRRLDEAHHLSATDAHWLAIGAMSLTSRLVKHLLPEFSWTDDWEALGNPIAPARPIIFDPRPFLETIEPTAGGEPLPHGWEVTSDSIAARMASLLSASELVLLKSTLPEPHVLTLKQAANVGYVDRAFPRFAVELPLVRCVNLRREEWPAIRLATHG